MDLIDILKIKYPDVDYRLDIQISDNGDGQFISAWNLSDPMPTQDDLDGWMKEFDLPYRQKCARECRIYPSTGDQLDMMYHDKVDGTNTWAEAIKAVKVAHPIPSK